MNEGNTGTSAEYKFKMSTVEKWITAVITIIFLLSLSEGQIRLWTIVLFAVGAVILVYYVIWYRKLSIYVKLDERSITIYVPPFFQPLTIDREKIEQIVASGKSIRILYQADGVKKKIGIYSVLLSEDDWKSLTLALNPQ